VRKFIIVAGLVVLIASSFVLLQPDSPHYIFIMRLLNRDRVYFNDGSVKNIWLWDDKGEVTIGENSEEEITVINRDEYKEIEQNKLLRYLKVLI